MTTPGLFLIPLSLLLILLPWRHSFVALVLLMILADVAVIIVGSFGVSPVFFYGNLIIARSAVEIAFGRRHLNQGVIEEIYPLFFLFAVNIVVLWIALSVFQGKIDVMTGTMGFNLNLAQPYHLTRENFTQIFYLAFHIVLVYAIAHQLSWLEPVAAAKIVDRAVVLAILLAAGFVFWELAAFHAGLTFPAWFFHSDVHSGAWGQVTAGHVLRASGSFPEPAGAAFVFGGFVLYAWKRYKLGIGSTMLSMGLLLISLVSLGASTSTTAFALMGFFALVAAKDMLGFHLRARGARSRLRPQDFVALLFLGAGLLGASLYLNARWETVDEVLTRAVFEKDQTGSFDARSSTDFMALDILVKTGGLGLGLGSHKPNSAVMTILSNTGILGSLAVGLFLFMRLKPYRPRLSATDEEPIPVTVPLQWLLIGFLLAHAISNPNINHIGVWMVSGLLIGIAAGQCRQFDAEERWYMLQTEGAEGRVRSYPRPLPLPSAGRSNAR
ncbi:hypothetical protein [Rhodospirillaceae bacterium SYSU D60014]|uniref:hypothetical protein n=1 Tax=Virgifigura deserti TaxID=2268457 RepID=UPI000E675B5D